MTVSKLGSVFKSISSLSPIHRLAPLFQKREKQFVQLKPKAKEKSPDPVAARTSDTGRAERRTRIRLKKGGRATADATFNEDAEDVIKRAAARRAKLLGG
jgi:hypothetical protein